MRHVSNSDWWIEDNMGFKPVCKHVDEIDDCKENLYACKRRRRMDNELLIIERNESSRSHTFLSFSVLSLPRFFCLNPSNDKK